MNEIQSLIDRQLGIYCQLNYDNVLKRLVVEDGEAYYGLQNTSVVDIYDQNPPIFACRFAETSGYEHILALANEDGRVAIQDTTTINTAKKLEGFQCHNNAVFDLAWMPGHMNFVTVSGDHSACLWDLRGGSPRRVLLFSAHSRSVKTAVFRRAPAPPAVFATGARDGHVLVWDTRAGSQPPLVLKPDNWLASCHAGAGAGPQTPGSRGKRARLERAVSITGLAFRDDCTLLSCGECDGNIKVWDLRKNYTVYKREPLPKHSIPYCGSSTRNAYTNLIVDESRTRLYASCMDNVIYCFNVATCSALPERRYIGHENSTFYIKTGLSPDGAYLVSGSSDKNAYVWNVKHSLPIVKLTGHRAEVTCAAWCQRGDLKIVTCSDDARHMIWRVGAEFPAKEELRGWAEEAARGESPPAWGTPVSLKRRASTTPTSVPSKRPRPERKTKRCLTALLEASRETDTELAAKRLRLESIEERSGTKRPRETTPPPAWSYPAPRPGTSFMSPTKNYEPRACRHLSPRKRDSTSPDSPNKVRVLCFSTPTKDLPDFVLNGEAPHLRLMSPPRKKANSTDWLTRLSRSRRADPAVPPQPVSLGLSPKENLPPRRNSCDKTPKSKKSRTLLKYFTVAGKDK